MPSQRVKSKPGSETFSTEFWIANKFREKRSISVESYFQDNSNYNKKIEKPQRSNGDVANLFKKSAPKTDVDVLMVLRKMDGRLAELQKEVAIIQRVVTVPEKKTSRVKRRGVKDKACHSHTQNTKRHCFCNKRINRHAHKRNKLKEKARKSESGKARNDKQSPSMKNVDLGQMLQLYLKTLTQSITKKQDRGIDCPSTQLKTYRNTDIMQELLVPPSHQKVAFPVFNNKDQSLDSYLSSITDSSASDQQNPMCIEWMRLESFRNFPVYAKVRPMRLAQAGFFYTGQTDQVKCYYCGQSYSGWQTNDDPIQVHSRISPSCCHVNGGDSNNIPIKYPDDVVATVTPQSTHTDQQRTDASRTEQQHDATTTQNGTTDESRHEGSTLRNGERTLQNGHSDALLYTGSSPCSNTSSDTSVAQRSNAQTHESQNGNASLQSKTNAASAAPTANSLQNGNTSVPTAQGNKQESKSNQYSSNKERSTVAKNRLHPLGISFEKPRYPAYAVLATRISTFQDWPAHLTQSPRDMASAGFLYAGYSDYARCFFCGGGLRNWEPGDDPWVEHARWFPKCSFLNQNKGDEFVALVQEQQAEQEQYESANANGLENGATGHNLPNNDVKDEEADDDSIFSKPAVLSVCEMGYDKDMVRKAIKKVRTSTGIDSISAAELMDVILEMEDTHSEARHDSTMDRTAPSSQLTNASNITEEDQKVTTELEDAETLETQSLIEENRRLKENFLCKICLDQNGCIAMLPCGHLCCCSSCAPAMRKCPICREFVKGTVRTWFA